MTETDIRKGSTKFMSLVKIKVLSKKIKVGKKSFLRYFTRLNLIVVGEEEKGKQTKSITVKFTEEVSKNLPKDRFFILTVDTNKDQISCPRKYEVRQIEDEKTGEMKDDYPTLWVRGYEEFTPIKPRPITDDVEFCVDEEPTEETEIIDDDISSEE